MTYYSTHLTDRAVLYIQGSDRESFLQGLISNDISKLKDNKPIFSLLLTPQGKVLFDFIIWQIDNDILIDCTEKQSDLLIQKLEFYKLRSNVTIEKTNLQIHAIWGNTLPSNILLDPRHAGLGGRIIGDKIDLDTTPVTLDDYIMHRIQHIVPEGMDEIPSNDSFPLEYGLHNLNGIDFKKGCFIGQEVTSRTYRRGKINKSLCIVKSHNVLTYNMPIISENRQVGAVRCVQNNLALALLRTESLDKNLTANDTPLEVITNGLKVNNLEHDNK